MPINTRRRRNRFAPSPTYGKPHPDLQIAQEQALFAQSIYDAAPEYIRKKAHQDGGLSLYNWFYSRSADPRPFDERYKIPSGYEMPPFPWDPRFTSFEDIFG